MPDRPGLWERLWARLRSPFDAVVDALDPILGGEHALRSALLAAFALAVAWYVYVPVHELLHAAGCAGTGCTVTTLEIQHQYGGGLLSRWLPFVEAGGEYPGRLSAFDTHGSDLRYLATDALPFSLSILVGVPLLRRAVGRPHPWRAGFGTVLGLAPFYNLPGDYYEMGSILVTSALPERFAPLRADDLVQLVERLSADPAALGLAPGQQLVAAGVVALGLGAGIALAYTTWWLGERFSSALPGAQHAPGRSGTSGEQEGHEGQQRDGKPDQHDREQAVKDADPE